MSRSEMKTSSTTSASLVRRLGVGALLIAALAAPAAQAGEKQIPKDNLVKNPTFAKGVKGWDGMDSKIKRVVTRNAPNGRQVARVTAAPGVDAFTLDDAPATVRRNAAKGVEYVGAAWVKGSPSNAGETVSIVVREWAQGDYVDSALGSATLKAGKFVRVKTTYTSQKANGQIDVY